MSEAVVGAGTGDARGVQATTTSAASVTIVTGFKVPVSASRRSTLVGGLNACRGQAGSQRGSRGQGLAAHAYADNARAECTHSSSTRACEYPQWACRTRHTPAPRRDEHEQGHGRSPKGPWPQCNRGANAGITRGFGPASQAACMMPSEPHSFTHHHEPIVEASFGSRTKRGRGPARGTVTGKQSLRPLGWPGPLTAWAGAPASG